MPQAQKEESGQETPNGKFGVSAPSISLPKGGGAIRGIGEKFAANPVTGTGSMTVPIATSPGRSGFGPQLSISYDSGSGNGVFGLGWGLSIPCISRKTDKGLPRYQDAEESDVFILSGAEDLVPVNRQDLDGSWVASHPGYGWDPEGFWVRDANGKLVVHEDERDGYHVRRYRPRIEGLFARIERWIRADNPADVHWRSISKDNILTIYGRDEYSRIFDPETPAHIFTWLISETRDDRGNGVVYKYKQEDGASVDLTLTHERNRGNRDNQHRNTNRYLKRIYYGNCISLLDDSGKRPPLLNLSDAEFLAKDWKFEVVFDYGEHDVNLPTPEGTLEWTCRKDPFSSYRAGFEVRTYRLCQRVLMFHHFPQEKNIGQDCLVRSTDFMYGYEQEPNNPCNPIYSYLVAVTQTGYRRTGDQYIKKPLPPLEFGYSRVPEPDESGKLPVQEVDDKSLENLPIGLDGITYQWIDLDGEGLSGILSEQNGGWLYKRNLSPLNNPVGHDRENTRAKFAPAELVPLMPASSMTGQARQEFLDLAGDGQVDLVALSGPTPGFYERTDEQGWELFKPFKSLPAIDWHSPNLKFVDLTGDGHADILVTEQEAFTWYPSLAEDGYARAEVVRQALDEEKGPRLVFADGTQSIYLADISGDGLTDLVRIRNREVCYWPNLGYGRFGAKVTMDQSPWFDHPDQFDQRRIRLADVDGSGTTDILYLGRDDVRIYFNQSGNSWSEPYRLTQFPHVDNLAAVIVLDLLGGGTACLVWSSPLSGDARQCMKYIDLMGGQKPHLLVSVKNNLGAETRVRYATSTRFYLEDKEKGEPWITRLPLPVHVVEQVQVYDYISRNRFVTRYAYHHGYFDGVEREFRGFGRVDQWDTEEFAALSKSDAFPMGDNIDPASHVPPVWTKTWFHTGIYIHRDHVSNYFAGIGPGEGEYYREPRLRSDEKDQEAAAGLLDDTVLPDSLTLDEEREACRALKGAMLRQEVYALDGSDREKIPYTITEQSFTIECLQPRQNNRHAVFFTHAREAINYHYERIPDDPRISHTMTLEVDPFGNVLKSVAIGYGRKTSPLLELRDQLKQTTTLITYTENSFTAPISADDDYRTPLPTEACTYELTGYSLAEDASRFQMTDFVQKVKDELILIYDDETNYEDEPGEGRQRRLIEHVRTSYRKDDLSGVCSLGETGALALPYQTYKLAFTPGLLEKVYRRLEKDGQWKKLIDLSILPADLTSDEPTTDRGGYVQVEGSEGWWIPSGQVRYTVEAVDAKNELAEAREHFFLPRVYVDPFGERSQVDFDDYDLLITGTKDPLQNQVLAENDYRVLQPKLVIDPNGNWTEAIFDALGMVAGTAVRGKGFEANGKPEGDSLDGFDPDLDPRAFNNADDPHDLAPKYLQNATTCMIYDLERFMSVQEPAFAATLARETHISKLEEEQKTDIQISFSYSDGLGREIQKKVQAEPENINGEAGLPRWVGNGWTIFNNKGKPVRQYEPFFSPLGKKGYQFEFGVQVGVSPILFYDPLERVVATLYPNHTYEKVVFDPWQQITYDVNDTVTFDPKKDADMKVFFEKIPESDYLPSWYDLRMDDANALKQWPDTESNGKPIPGNARRRADEKSAAFKAALHEDTPAVAHFDTLGRTFLTIAHNKFERKSNGIVVEIVEEKYSTRVELDVENNQRAVIDARDRIVMRYDYDMLGNRIHQTSMDAGERWTLNEVTSKPIRAWDSRHFTREIFYDALRRPVDLFVNDDTGRRLAERTVYGESMGSGTNHRTRVYQVWDGAGIVTSIAYDFKGNLLESTRQLLRNYRDQVNWRETPDLEVEIFASRTSYDALNRPITVCTPDGSVYRPRFNEANLLDQVKVNMRGAVETTTFVANIDYNAKGQRTCIEYNDVEIHPIITEYTYDADTFRLTRLLTNRPLYPETDKRRLQDLSYTYDPVGNITSIRDDAQPRVFFDNDCIDASNDYQYDAIYRLIGATGREHGGQDLQPNWDDTQRIGYSPIPYDCSALRRYIEIYHYDEVGNILKMIHHLGDNLNSPGTVVWNRRYQYYPENNRLRSTSMAGELDQPAYSNNPVAQYAYGYTYDDHGNMTSMPHLLLMEWDFKDQLHATSQQTRGDDGIPEITYYVYDAAGQRVRKVTERQANPGEAPRRKNERIYLGGYEIFRQYNGSNGNEPELERETLHVMDDKQRIALVETKIRDTSAPTATLPETLIRYQIGNHLGSAALELDEQAQVLTYEEYFPYGGSSYQCGRSKTEVKLKRYRYTGKERDGESGLNYHEARHYIPWLGRWISCDSEWSYDASNLYGYARCNPITIIDPSGNNDEFALSTSETVSHFFTHPTEATEFIATYIKHMSTSAQLSTVLNKLHQQPLLPEYMRLANRLTKLKETITMASKFMGTHKTPTLLKWPVSQANSLIRWGAQYLEKHRGGPYPWNSGYGQKIQNFLGKYVNKPLSFVSKYIAKPMAVGSSAAIGWYKMPEKSSLVAKGTNALLSGEWSLFELTKPSLIFGDILFEDVLGRKDLAPSTLARGTATALTALGEGFVTQNDATLESFHKASKGGQHSWATYVGSWLYEYSKHNYAKEGKGLETLGKEFSVRALSEGLFKGITSTLIDWEMKHGAHLVWHEQTRGPY